MLASANHQLQRLSHCSDVGSDVNGVGHHQCKHHGDKEKTRRVLAHGPAGVTEAMRRKVRAVLTASERYAQDSLTRRGIPAKAGSQASLLGVQLVKPEHVVKEFVGLDKK